MMSVASRVEGGMRTGDVNRGDDRPCALRECIVPRAKTNRSERLLPDMAHDPLFTETAVTGGLSLLPARVLDRACVCRREQPAAMRLASPSDEETPCASDDHGRHEADSRAAIPAFPLRLLSQKEQSATFASPPSEKPQ